LDELDEKPNHTKISNFKILKERVARQRIHLENHLIKNDVQWVQNVWL